MQDVTREDIWKDELKRVHREVDDGWRHGCEIYEVYHREEDNTYWSVCYRVSTGGEYNGLSGDDGDCDLCQVRRTEETKVVVKYIPIKKEG